MEFKLLKQRDNYPVNYLLKQMLAWSLNAFWYSGTQQLDTHGVLVA